MTNDLSTSSPLPPRFYTVHGGITVSRANLPHWSQNECTCFITFRLADSLPTEALIRLQTIAQLSAGVPEEEIEESALMQRCLDEGHGSCLLQNDAARQIVESALLHFNGLRYQLYAFVVMPNHVHVLFMPFADWNQEKILHSWKSFTAKELNHLNSQSGIVWQKEYWDTLIRNEPHFRKVMNYIHKNDPTKFWSAYAASPEARNQ